MGTKHLEQEIRRIRILVRYERYGRMHSWDCEDVGQISEGTWWIVGGVRGKPQSLAVAGLMGSGLAVHARVAGRVLCCVTVGVKVRRVEVETTMRPLSEHPKQEARLPLQ
jgi:hypothetical protein